MDTNTQNIDFNQKNLLKTDIYIDRYLPCRTLNLIQAVFLTAFSNHNDNKHFLEKLVHKYEVQKEKIKTEEAKDAKVNIAAGAKLTCYLNKEQYHAPHINIPESIDSSDEDSDERDSEDPEDVHEGRGRRNRITEESEEGENG